MFKKFVKTPKIKVCKTLKIYQKKQSKVRKTPKNKEEKNM